MSRAATLLAFDYGEKRIGVAVGNTLTRQARALLVLENRNREYRFDEIGKLIGEWKPDLVPATAICSRPGWPGCWPNAA
jgi:putative Holliday junction resolvase